MSALSHAFDSLIGEYGVPALFVTMFFETLGAPLPGESALILSAGAAAAGKLDIRAVVVAAWLGSVLGDNVAYLIGRRLGRPVILRYGGRVGITEARYAKAEAIAKRHGPLMVMAARFVVVLRQLNGLVAGTTGMRWPTFIAANLVGAGLWVAVWTTLAYKFGRKLDVLPFFWHHLSLVAAIAIPLLIAALAVLHLRHRGPQAR
jgi:membrane protein DedA with SNARE-associated domain